MASAWIFGYGSLVFRAGFPHLSHAPGWLGGFRRRLWQGSPDHRGTPAAPGRVATLVPEPGARVLGRAFEVAEEHLDEVLERLDLREQAGYERHQRPIELVPIDRVIADRSMGDHVQVDLAPRRRIQAIVYAAGPTNPSWLGPADPATIARHVAAARGPSGDNSEYVLRLAEALRDLAGPDATHLHDDEVLLVAAELTRL